MKTDKEAAAKWIEIIRDEYQKRYDETRPGQTFPQMPDRWVIDAICKHKEESRLYLLREIIMRANLAMPENEQDEKWFDEGIDPKVDNNFIERLFKELGLGILPTPPQTNK